jgi:hypothetical protein
VVLDRSLVGPIGLVVKVTTLQEYGVDKFFILENDNVDASQRNVVFIARGEGGRHVQSIAGESGAAEGRTGGRTDGATAQKQTARASPRRHHRRWS